MGATFAQGKVGQAFSFDGFDHVAITKQPAVSDKFTFSAWVNFNSGRVFEVFASKAGTWSIVITGPDGLACLVAVGNGWHDVPPAPAGERA